MTKTELIDFIADNKSNFTQLLKKYHHSVYHKIDLMYDYNSFSQKIYDYIYNPHKKCIVCDNTTQYLGINQGYNKTCSNKCKGIARHNESIETRNCVICNSQFDVYKVRKKTTCSQNCLSILNKSDDVNIKRVASYKKTIREKYDVEWYSHTDEFRDKLHQHHIYGRFDYTDISIRSKQTKLERYGDENYNNIEKAKATLLDRYGVENYSQTIQFKKIHYDKVISRIPPTIKLIEDFNDYNGVSNGVYSFKCTECDTKFTSTLNNGIIPICRVCNPPEWNNSKFETEILEYIKTIYNGNIISGDRTKISPRELDIVINDMNIAIECNGNYWHSEVTGNKDKNYHLSKTNACKKNGIRLIHIFEDEWVQKNDIVKRRLSNILGLNPNRIYAKNCVVSEITSSIKSDFLSRTHIQGNDKSNVKLGLFYSDELVGVMTFSKRKIFGNSEWELVRFSTSRTVVGGASKLFKHFIKVYNPVKVTTYSDIRWNTGDVYLKMGFSLVGQSNPGYFYLKGGVRYNRINFQKHKLKDKLEVFDPNLTEWENMQLNGYDRIWDCGHYKYVMEF
jgi:predicted nucleic acid-binding Zn ribbon protein